MGVKKPTRVVGVKYAAVAFLGDGVTFCYLMWRLRKAHQQFKVSASAVLFWYCAIFQSTSRDAPELRPIFSSGVV